MQAATTDHRRTRLADRDVTMLQQAEAVAGALMAAAMAPETTDVECTEHLDGYCQRAGVPTPADVDFARLRARVADLTAQWQATEIGSALTVEW